MKTFEAQLATASDEWVSAGLITAPQPAAILARHPVPEQGATPNRFLGILAGVGGALFVVGVSLVIKSNWQQIGDWVKIGGLVALLLGSYAAGWKLKVSPGQYPKLGDGCFMVGAVLFLLGIALVSQIFHLGDRPANGVLLWWAGIAALPWLVQAKGAQFVSVAAGLTWLGMELEAGDSVLRLAYSSERWYGGSYYPLAAAGFLVGMALLFFGTGLRGRRHEAFAGLHEKLGLLLMGWSLYSLGFQWHAHQWGRNSLDAARLLPVAFLVALATVALAWAWRRDPARVRPLLWFLPLGLLPVMATLFGFQLGLIDSTWLWGALACLGLFLLNVGMIRVGLAEGREGWINLGVAGIALNLVTRYFVLFGTMLEGGVFFIVTGLLVLGLGYVLERKRRALVGAVRKETVS